jgi:hypothetical protein
MGRYALTVITILGCLFTVALVIFNVHEEWRIAVAHGSGDHGFMDNGTRPGWLGILGFIYDYRFWWVSLFVWSVISIKSTIFAVRSGDRPWQWMSIGSSIVAGAITGNLILEGFKYFGDAEGFKIASIDVSILLQAFEYLMQIVFVGAFACQARSNSR